MKFKGSGGILSTKLSATTELDTSKFSEDRGATGET